MKIIFEKYKIIPINNGRYAKTGNDKIAWLTLFLDKFCQSTRKKTLNNLAIRSHLNNQNCK